MNILIVDDDPDFGDGLSELLQVLGHDASVAESCAVGIAKARTGGFDLGFLDVKLGDGSGIDVLAVVTAEKLIPACVVVTGHLATAWEQEASRHGACAVLQKPVDIDALERVLSENGG